MDSRSEKLIATILSVDTKQTVLILFYCGGWESIIGATLSLKEGTYEQVLRGADLKLTSQLYFSVLLLHVSGSDRSHFLSNPRKFQNFSSPTSVFSARSNELANHFTFRPSIPVSSDLLFDHFRHSTRLQLPGGMRSDRRGPPHETRKRVKIFRTKNPGIKFQIFSFDWNVADWTVHETTNPRTWKFWF